jgi:uncharacterized protein
LPLPKYWGGEIRLSPEEFTVNSALTVSRQNDGMRRDDLNIPLQRRSLAQRLWAKRPSALALAYGASTLAFLVAGTYAARTPLPFAGEPVVIAAVPAAEEIITASVEPVVPAAAEASEETVVETETNATEEFDTALADAAPEVPQDASRADQGVEQVGRKKVILKVEDVPRQDTYKEASGNIIMSSRRPLRAAPIKEISQITPDGLLPIASGSMKSSNLYARPVPMGVVHSEAPKIVIVLGGLGISNKLTQRAIKELPADVTLAFAPYGDNLQNSVNDARREGHEVFLQVPLEPMGYPATNPGPKTLLSESNEAENIASLHWHMTRFAGYAGVINYMGGKFLTQENSSKVLLRELRKRGLLFVEDGSVSNSTVEAVAQSMNGKAKRADQVIDADPNPDAILAALKRLEKEAEQNGIAIGSGSGLAVTIDTLRDWSKDAAERGIVIIPMSAAFKGRLG